MMGQYPQQILNATLSGRYFQYSIQFSVVPVELKRSALFHPPLEARLRQGFAGLCGSSAEALA
jgi:hypothetical protein